MNQILITKDNNISYLDSFYYLNTSINRKNKKYLLIFLLSVILIIIISFWFLHSFFDRIKTKKQEYYSKRKI